MRQYRDRGHIMLNSTIKTFFNTVNLPPSNTDSAFQFHSIVNYFSYDSMTYKGIQREEEFVVFGLINETPTYYAIRVSSNQIYHVAQINEPDEMYMFDSNTTSKNLLPEIAKKQFKVCLFQYANSPHLVYFSEHSQSMKVFTKLIKEKLA